MVQAKVAYEEIRRQRVEENKKRMEELHLPLLSLSLKKQLSPKPSPVKRGTARVIRKELIAVRRSSRISNQPVPVYKELVTYERPEFPRRYRNMNGNSKRDLSNRVYASDEARDWAISRAEELESGLESDYPTFVKPMTQSHVTGGFWLGLPCYFCRKNLPKRDETVTLIDEEGEEYPVVYLARKNGLSGGWKGFAVVHELVDGDAVVFQLIRPTELKVYIIRAANCMKEGDNL
ncbi:B3 domain-containing protein Os06g0194400-like [Rhododendron vialii]|uniref:B3 domain-containing protein Os06g0194400-like n=1 Tax=Rhododendron vialii TaxID=182163 RepID=UPI0026600F9E|nr:B3 domain-containing protein Os06g0194400-like [Rhododendron vialii]XP_058224959.1 B3 domain-containing protein Os06g0194400-like [Rhododendron vialii]XP_058224960.1 B3 domain-containing protein Os06g0194400-like [Rhododendron vialii]